MAYSELIKNFSKTRDYMNQFYVYGFKSRNEYNQKSTRSYDNEKRRIESWLGDYMAFRQGANGKNVFLSVDSRAIAHNPLYKAFKAKSFTDNDITLHFYILDILSDNAMHSVTDIINQISENYLSVFDNAKVLDESTIRKKINEYVKLGIISSQKQGREKLYCLSKNSLRLSQWYNAVSFFSEADELGVIGSYILDKYNRNANHFSFKHHYILHALESEILYTLLSAINEKKKIRIDTYESRKTELKSIDILPLKIYISTQGGRRYLLCFNYKRGKTVFLRLDSIKKATVIGKEEKYSYYIDFYNNELKNKLWGVSTGKMPRCDHIEMTILVNEGEDYIVNRLEREKRCGTVEKLDDSHYKFTADVFDAVEMLPWIRTFTGRIEELICTNKYVTNTFYGDLEEMKKIYGGSNDF